MKTYSTRLRMIATYILLLGLAVWFIIMGWWIALAIEVVLYIAGVVGISFFMVSFILKRKTPVSLGDVIGLSEGDELSEYVKDAVEWLETGELWEQTSEDGLKLQGRFVKNGDSHTYAICCHGYKNHRMQDISNQAKHFYDLGHNVFAGHARGHGRSEGDYVGMGYFERRDVAGWIKRIVDMDPDARIFLFGVSMGGATVMTTSGEDLPANVKCVIEDCGYSSIWKEFCHQLTGTYGIHVHPVLDLCQIICKSRYGFGFKDHSALEQIKKAKVPFLFIHGDKDNFVPFFMLEPIYNACASEHKKKVIIKDSAHAENYYTDPKLYWSEIEDWLDRYL